MTEEELEKEAGEYAKPFYNMTRYDYVAERTHVKEAYYKGAEPREKRIEELETRCTELFLQNNEFAEQLTKAKKIIRTFLNMPMPNNEEVFADVGMFLTKAEQFLKEIEE